MEPPLISPLASQIPHIATAVLPRVAVKQLRIETLFRHSYPIVRVGLRCKIAHRHHKLVPILLSAHKSHDTVPVVGAINPLKPILSKILTVKCPFAAVQIVQILKKQLQLLVRIELQQLPLQIPPNVPLVPLAELHPHKDRFLSGMSKHKSKQTPHVCKLLPFVPWHFPDDVSLAVHYLIVGQSQHEILAVVVPHTESYVVLVELAEHGSMWK